MKKNILYLIIIFQFLVVGLFCRYEVRSDNAQDIPILKRKIIHKKSSYCYYVYFPSEYDINKKWPVMLYLHGLGHNGNAWELMTGLGKAIKRNPQRFPLIIVAPECPYGKFWPGDMTAMAVSVLDSVVKEFNGDLKRLYVSGVSMGGTGAWVSAIQNPGKYAAIIPACGGLFPPPVLAKKIKKGISEYLLNILESENPYKLSAEIIGQTPVWIFHGTLDKIIPVSESRKMKKALLAQNGEVKYTEYPDKGHGIWNIVYENPDLMEWMLSKRIE